MQAKATMRPSAATRAVLMLLLVVCLVDCATGSCLSYGHSCWGAHGKRSGKAPASAPDWYITRILRRMAANTEMNRAQNLEGQDNDIYRADMEDVAANKFTNDNEVLPVENRGKGLEGKPMLDDDMLSKIKFWQIMRAASDEK